MIIANLCSEVNGAIDEGSRSYKIEEEEEEADPGELIAVLVPVDEEECLRALSHEGQR